MCRDKLLVVHILFNGLCLLIGDFVECGKDGGFKLHDHNREKCLRWLRRTWWLVPQVLESHPQDQTAFFGHRLVESRDDVVDVVDVVDRVAVCG